MILTDANILVALTDESQAHSARCRATFATVSLPMITTWPAFTEAMYLLYRLGGWYLQESLWTYVENNGLVFHSSTHEEQLRMKVLMAQYQDRPMDLADASLVAAAESLNVTRIFTLDSDFYFYRLKDTGVFEVIP